MYPLHKRIAMIKTHQYVSPLQDIDFYNYFIFYKNKIKFANHKTYYFITKNK